MLKPSDFFVSIIDFFAILLPGALLTLILTSTTLSDVALPADLLREFTGARGSFAFFVAAYVIGHIAATLSGPLDPLADWVASKAEPPHARALRAYAQGEMKRRVKDGEEFSFKLGFIGSYVRQHSSVAASDLDRLQAVSRFFRSLFSVSIAALFLLRSAVTPEVAPAAIMLALFSIWLFGYQRWRRRLAIYTSFVVMACCPPPTK